LPERALRNPFRVHLFTRLVTQGSRSARQPWAILFNRFAVGTPKLVYNNEGVALGCRMSVFQT